MVLSLPSPTSSTCCLPFPAADPAALPLLAEQRELRGSGLVSSVYFDSPDSLHSYHTRLRKEDYATAVRVRW